MVNILGLLVKKTRANRGLVLRPTVTAN